MFDNLRPSTVAIVLVAVLLMVGEILHVAENIARLPMDATLDDATKLLLSTFVLLVGGKIASREVNGK